MRDDQSGPDGFARRLSELKGEGANVLVSGAVPDGVHAAVCRDFLGDPTDSRRRLVVLADHAPVGLDAVLDPDHDRSPDRLHVVDYGGGTRSSAGRTAGVGGVGPNGDGPREDGGIPPSALTVVEAGDLPGLGAGITEAIDGFETVAGGLDPAELRVCFDSLGPLVAEHGRSTVFRFLHLLTERVRRAAGLAAYHLPVAPDEESVAMLGSLFEATVELRVADGRPQQRWDLGDVRSEWLPLRDAPR